MAIGEEVDLFLRKVDRRLDVNTQGNQRLGEAVHTLGEFPLQRAQGVARCLAGTGLDQVGDGFGLRQVELVVKEGALAELARASQTTADLYTALQQHVQNHRAAVSLQFKHVLTSERIRPGKEQSNPFVQHQPFIVAERTVMGMPRGQGAASDQQAGLGSQRAGQPDNSHTAPALGRGDGGDGFTHSVHARKPLRQKLQIAKTPH
ncbi:hypothetical protein D9M73_145700 [compost metagenome]